MAQQRATVKGQVVLASRQQIVKTKNLFFLINTVGQILKPHLSIVMLCK